MKAVIKKEKIRKKKKIKIISKKEEKYWNLIIMKNQDLIKNYWFFLYF